MKTPSLHGSCDCFSTLSRREFLKTSAAFVTAASAGGSLLAQAQENRPKCETLVSTLYKSLSEEQRKVVCFGFDHPLRSKVDNNWQITDKTITEFFNKDQ